MSTQVVHQRGPAGELHALDMPTGEDPGAIWVMEPVRPALVMGSAQRPEMFDLPGLEEAGVELAARRSGGGAVFIEPRSVVWIDVLAPREGPWWHDDLAETFMRTGRAWQRALDACGVPSELCETAPVRSAASSLACWAGLGWGELTVGSHKVVGLSQRRTRWGARIQAMAVLDQSFTRVAEFLDPTNRAPVVEHFAELGAAEEPTIGRSELLAAALAALTG